MTREELEHIIAAAARIADDDDIVVIGSQSVLGQFPDAPAELCVSMEADVWPRNRPERWELIDGAIGELSLFHDTFGDYAQGVGPETAVLPEGWESRLVPVRTTATRGATGWCLEIHDLLISKYVAGREKDRVFVRAAIVHGLAQQASLELLLGVTPVPEERKEELRRAIARDFGAVRGP